jgi:hypothetical protein
MKQENTEINVQPVEILRDYFNEDVARSARACPPSLTADPGSVRLAAAWLGGLIDYGVLAAILLPVCLCLSFCQFTSPLAEKFSSSPVLINLAETAPDIIVKYLNSIPF